MDGLSDPWLGQTLDARYHLLEHVGTGGMASVYRACQLNVGRDVAVKILNSVLLTSSQAAARFEMEARIISRLRHPNTLKLIDFGRLLDGRPYLVTEFLVGRTLEKTILQGPLHPTWTLLILRQICDAMAEAHELQIIHRDLKPGNIFLERVGDDEIVKVLDFGIAKLAGASTHVTAAGSVCGTPCYMSPEQAAGDELDLRSDLYSLGVIAYECLTGRPPFVAAQAASLLFQHINDAPPPLPEKVPQDIAALVMSLLEKDVTRRPQTAKEVRGQIDQILLKGTIDLEALRCTLETPSIPIHLTQPDAKLSGGQLQRVGAMLLLIALLIAGASWKFLRDTPEQEAPGTYTPLAEAPRPDPEPEQVLAAAVAAAEEPAIEAAEAEEPVPVKPRAARSSKKRPPPPKVVPTERGFVDFAL